jgi:hypothetical protein
VAQANGWFEYPITGTKIEENLSCKVEREIPQDAEIARSVR